MPYIINIDDKLCQTADLQVDTYSTTSMSLRNFPPSFISLLQSIKEHNNNERDNSVFRHPILEQNYYRYHNLSENYPKIGLLNYFASKSSSFIQHVNTKMSPPLKEISSEDLYPIAVRYTNNRDVWIIERPPFQANVTFKSARSNSSLQKSSTYQIWMPWTVMVLNVNFSSSYYSARLLFNDKPLESFDDKLMSCFFPNMYNDARMCLNQTSVELQQYLASTNSYNISTVYNYIINDYMSGGWNTDLGVGAYTAHFSSHNQNTPSLEKMKNVIYNGDSDLKIKSVYSPTGRISYNKQIINLLKYTSTLSMDEMLKIISEAKNISTSDYFALSNIIKDSHSRENDISNFTDLLIDYNRCNFDSYIHSQYVIIYTPEVYEILRSEQSRKDEYLALTKNFLQFVNNLSLNKIQKMFLDDSKLIQTDVYLDNPYILISDINTFHAIGFHDSLPKEFTKEFSLVVN